MAEPLRVGISHGDINGISYEVIIKALDDERITELFTPIIFGVEKVLNFYRKALNKENFEVNIINDASEAVPGKVNLVNITDTELRISMGEPTEVSGMSALLSIDRACTALEEGKIDVLVTAPISKRAIHSDEFNFRGHTDYLENRFAEEGDKALMILFQEELRVALVTVHVPVTEVSELITKENVADKIRRFEQVLKRDFRIEKPKIAVLSLDPHCGDHGVIGNRDDEEVTPAIRQCIDEGILAFGPYAADGFFGSGDYRRYDGVLAMYHDQGLAPFKAIAHGRGVNYTGGLNCIRTSPDHGVGYDIAGRGIAEAFSMRKAMYSAIDLYRSRQAYDAAEANPLPQLEDRRQNKDKNKDKAPAAEAPETAEAETPGEEQ